ncbi:MAG: 5-oxoprolinase subunit PxpA [Vicinamibacterales bacterium]
MRIDLNCDMGESFGAYTIGSDEAVLASVTSINVACGFHAGDPSVMRRTIRLARAAGVAVGAHPGFPDLVGFGRRELNASEDEVEDMVLYQVAAIAGVARAEGVELRHVKAHGALYNMAVKDRRLADAIARAVKAFDPSLRFFAPARSILFEAGAACGLRTVAEAFADRAYEDDGTLTSRKVAGAILHDPATVVARIRRLVQEGRIRTRTGADLELPVATICTHGDTAGAAELTRQLRAGLEAAGVSVRAPD